MTNNGILHAMRYRQKRFYCWSPEIAYSVGLMASDGCLQSDGRHLDLTSKDISQLENFAKALGRDFKVGTKNNGTNQQAYRIQFGDVAYYDFLMAVGLTPAKSKTMPALKIPDAFYCHFLRGLFDGDGSTYGYFDPRWPKSFLYYTAFTSASMDFLIYISINNQRLFQVKGQSIRQSSRAFSLVYGKADSHILYEFIYQDAGELYLPRKKLKLEDFVKQDNDATILRLQARVVKLVNTQP